MIPPLNLETARLHLRCPMPGDAPELYLAITESLPELQPWLSEYAVAPSLTVCEVEVRRGQRRFLAGEYLWYLLFLKETQSLVGSCGLHHINWSVPQFEIGYWVRTGYARHGYITEAVAAVCHMAFTLLHARRLEIRCDSLNERSVAVARRLDFMHEATLVFETWNNYVGEPRDTMVFVKWGAVK